MPQTKYGRIKPGKSQYIVIAPHAAGDDLKSGLIASKLAKRLEAFLVVNKIYKKPGNSACKIAPNICEDFNKLLWSKKHDKYLWKKKQPAMKQFFTDIAKFNEQAKLQTGAKKAVNVYIHSYTSKESGLDIGAGLRPGKFKSKLFGSRKHYSVGNNSGEVTIKIGDIKKLKNFLEKKLIKDYNLNVTIGESYSGWSRQSAIQFHKCEGRNDYALQLEISQHLRRLPKDIEYTVDLIAQAILLIFNK